MPFPFNKPKNIETAKEVLKEIIKQKPKTFAEAENIKNEICGKHGISTISNTEILQVAKQISSSKCQTSDNLNYLKKILQKRSVRTQSGVAVITVLTKPFGCPGKCVFCPQEKTSNCGETLFERDFRNKKKTEGSSPKCRIQNQGVIHKKYKKAGTDVMPKSYFSNEPAASRALLTNFDPYVQVKSRLKSLEITGHNTSKIELIILGGTFSYLPKSYRTWFVRRIFQALNANVETKNLASLQSLQTQNETANHRCIAIVIETRPDYIDKEEIKYLRKLGVTKVELGVQSLNDKVLDLCKRGHSVNDSANAIKLLRNAGFKIGIHMMPGLPGSSPKKDLEQFKKLYSDERFKPDFLKIYPCTTVPFSELDEWRKQGKYKALTQEQLFPLLLDIKKITPEYTRISRLIRDIPATSITDGSKMINMRQLLQDKMKKTNEMCQCIRCREIKNTKHKIKNAKLKILRYEASGGAEYFLSYITEDNKLLALLRLRLPYNQDKSIFKALQNAAIIRELHTYGTVVPVGQKKNKNKSQHSGLGKKLIREAEKIVKKVGIKKIAVISGIGVKGYYRKLGYVDDRYYLVKSL